MVKKAGEVELRILRKSPEVKLPCYETEGAAGMDLRAFIEGEAVVIPPLGRAKIPTGLFPEIPPGYEGQVRPRSGLAFREGLTVLNSPGTIDSDYRGELEILLINLGTENYAIHRGDRIAQLVIVPLCRVSVREAEGRLPDTERGTGGFGSTGV